MDCLDPDCAGTPSCTAATLLFNEINSNIASGLDLVELLVTGAGTTDGITLVQDGTNLDVLAVLPDVVVAQGDLIVVHLNPSSAPGGAPLSETATKNEFPNAMFSANYDNAWDFHGGSAGLTFNNRVLRLEADGGGVIDAVPFVLSNAASPAAAFPGDLQAMQFAGLWLPADCAGSPCDYTTTPTAVSISVDYLGCGTTPIGNSVSRKLGLATKQKSDWNLAGAHTWGSPNS